MSTIFSKIISGEIPSYKIAEDELFYAFLDINPVSKGHTLVVPKKEVDYIFDIEDDLLKEMMPFCKRVSQAIKKVVPCLRVGVAVVGLEVPHAHVHLIPLQSMRDFSFANKINLEKSEFEELANKIGAAFR